MVNEKPKIIVRKIWLSQWGGLYEKIGIPVRRGAPAARRLPKGVRRLLRSHGLHPGPSKITRGENRGGPPEEREAGARLAGVPGLRGKNGIVPARHKAPRA